MMHHPFVPLVVLVLCPLLAGGAALGVCRRRAFRLSVLAVVVGIALIGCWAGGVDFLYLKRMKVFLAAAVVLLVVWPVPAWRRVGDGQRRGATSGLFGLSVVAILTLAVHFNFGAFHGTGANRVWIHLHDVAHYYLGARYFPELGYGDLYTAMLRAEAERYGDVFRAIEVRDLRSNALVHIRVLLQQSGSVKARFTPARWEEFTRDVAWFRETLGPHYGEVLKDHGFNPTPAWALLFGPIANLVPAGSGGGILLLTLLDPLLLAGTLTAVAATFGRRAGLLSLIYFCLPFGASFGWTGGCFLRFDWLAGVVVAVCCLERRRHAWAGALIALASLLRVFPAAFALAVGLGAVARRWRTGRIDPAHLRFGAAFAAVAAVVLAGSLLRADGPDHWRGFHANMHSHLQSGAFNTIGLNEIASYAGPEKPSTPAAFVAETDRRSRLYLLQLVTVFPLAVLVVLAMSGTGDDARTAAMAPLLLFVGLSLASYYWIVLVLFAALSAGDRRALGWLFGAEVLMYALGLFEEREVVLYFYKNLLVGGLLLALYGSWWARHGPDVDPRWWGRAGDRRPGTSAAPGACAPGTDPGRSGG